MNNGVIANYIRISVDDEDTRKENKFESNSISNQRRLLHDFIKRTPDEFDGMQIIEFCDDGWSGTNFERPGVIELLEQVKAGNIQCVIVKDFSRFGRNYLEVGDYLEQIFPELGVRFISINDGYDSNNHKGTTGGMDIAFKNLIYDLYSRDLSAKVRAAKKSMVKQGKYISSYAFYGYIKDPSDKHKLLVDEEAAKVIRRIYKQARQGISNVDIAKKLNHENISTPSARKKELGIERKFFANKQHNFWSSKQIRTILADERYTGKMISGKNLVTEIGGKKQRAVPKEQWIVVPNAFGAIIPEQQFAEINRKRKYKPSPKLKAGDEKKLFSGKIKCGYCKQAMTRGGSRMTNPTYYCYNRRYFENAQCTSEKIPEQVIVETILQAIKQITLHANTMKKYEETEKKNDEVILDTYRKEIPNLKNAIKRMALEKIEFWEKLQDGLITNESFISRSNELSTTINDCEMEISGKEIQMKEIQKRIDSNHLIVEKFSPCSKMQNLTREMVNKLIDVIYIYDSQRIEIIFHCADEYAKLLENLARRN